MTLSAILTWQLFLCLKSHDNSVKTIGSSFIVRDLGFSATAGDH